MSSSYGTPLGQFSIGGFPDADSLSVADPLAGLLSDVSKPREFLVRANPRYLPDIDDVLNYPRLYDQVVSVDLSTNGYIGSLTTTPIGLIFEAKDLAYDQSPASDGYRITLNNGSAPDIAWRGSNSFLGFAVGSKITLSGGASQPGTWTILEVDPSGLWVRVAEYLNNASNVSVAVVITYSSFKYFDGVVSKPYNYSASLPTPELFGGAVQSAGSIVVNNSDGLLDHVALHGWLGATADVYVGERNAALNEFTRIFSGTVAGIEKSIDKFTIINKDLRYRLERRLQSRRYKGFGAALRFNGSSDFSTLGTYTTLHSCTHTIRFRCFGDNTAVNLQVILAQASVWSVAGVDFYVFINTSGDLSIVSHRAMGGSAGVTYTGHDLRDSEWHDLAVVLDAGTNQCRLVLDFETVATFTEPGFTAVPGTVMHGSILGGSANFFNGEIDESIGWKTAMTDDEIAEAGGREQVAPSSVNMIYYYTLNDGELTTVTATIGSNGTTNADWVGSMEGDVSLFDAPKPVCLGQIDHVTPAPVDPQNLVYAVNFRGVEGIDGVFDSGDPYIFDSDEADPFDATPASGHYITCNALGLFRIGSPPLGLLTANVRGDNEGPLGYTETTATIHRKVATELGSLTYPNDLDVASYSVLPATQTVGFYFDYDIQASDALDEIASGACCWWAGDRLSRSTLGRIENPDTHVATVSFARSDFVDPANGGTFKISPLGAQVKKVKLGYRPYATEFSLDQTADVLDMRDRHDLTLGYRFVTAPLSDDGTIVPDDADILTVYTAIYDEAAAQAEALRLFDIWRVQRSIASLTLSTGILTHFIGTKATMDHRYELSDGKGAVVVSIEEDMGSFGTADRLEVSFFV